MLLIITALVLGGGEPPPTLLPEAINSAVEFTPIGQLDDAIHSPWTGVDLDVPALLSLAASRSRLSSWSIGARAA